jgi:hypothetical protein
MRPRLGFYGLVAACAVVKGRAPSVRALLASAPRRSRRRPKRRLKRP